jgi:hypothetical protein
MKNSQVILSIISGISLAFSIVSKPVIASTNSQSVIIYVDPETCVRRGGKPISDNQCRLMPISLTSYTVSSQVNNVEGEIEDCKITQRGCPRRVA